MKLDKLRKEIEIIDKDLALLIEKRLKICQEIGEEKKKLTVPFLLKKFEEASGSEFVNDRMLLK